jgi:hypothetical protein
LRDAIIAATGRLHAPGGTAVSVGKHQMTRVERSRWGVHPPDAGPVVETDLG